MAITVGVDIGGTKVLAVIAEGPKVLKRYGARVRGRGFEAAIEAVDRLFDGKIAGDYGVSAIGLGVAGAVDMRTRLVAFSPNLELDGHDVAGAVEERFGLPVAIDNDANMAAFAEWRFGAGVGASAMLMITVGTGVGGGIVIDGDIYRGARGLAGELGHVIIDESGPLCACGNHGCLEALASGTAISRVARELMQNRSSIIARLTGGSDEKVTGEVVADAAEAGDEVAIEAIRRAGHYMGIGLASLAHAFDPEVIVLGGGVASGVDGYLDDAAKTFAKMYLVSPDAPRLVKARLGNDAGVIGAAALAGRLSGS
ncbi:MAG: ROK family protein [Actinobacteria bacterium]|nr:ROK family protein [Actinomycetota bacterium]